MQNDFQKTEAVFLRLDEAINNAEEIAEKKQEQLRARHSNADQRLNASLGMNEQLKQKTAEIAIDVEKAINHLDKGLNENVSRNHNN